MTTAKKYIVNKIKDMSDEDISKNIVDGLTFYLHLCPFWMPFRLQYVANKIKESYQIKNDATRTDYSSASNMRNFFYCKLFELNSYYYLFYRDHNKLIQLWKPPQYQKQEQ